ncbi:MAG: endonuclease NucS [Candidatus Bathyarchaeia archaeon]
MNINESLIFRLNPGSEEVQKLLAEGISKHLVIILVGDFRVDYEGRAASSLDFGERILMIKRDRAVLVHRVDGYEPVNWQPGGGVINVTLEGDMLVVRALRRTPREVLKLSFRNVKILTLLELRDESLFRLYASEEDMRRAILANPEQIGKWFKPTSIEKRVEPGFIDVYVFDSEGRLVVIEIKRDSAGRDAALQLARYVESLKRESLREVRGLLVAPNLRKGTQKMLDALNIEYRRLGPKKCFEALRRSEYKKFSDYLS